MMIFAVSRLRLIKEIGGARDGVFEGGLMFIETITEYKENQKVSFDFNSLLRKPY